MISKGPNPAQFSAIRHKDGPMMVLAGPGSGKTYVITQRLKYLVADCGIAAPSILVITFTRAAAQQMEERAQLLDDGLCGVTFGTFHSVYFHILQSAFHYTTDHILTGQQKLLYLKEALQYISVDVQESLLTEQLLSSFSYIKNAGIPVDSYTPHDALLSQEDFLTVYHAYHKLLKEDHKLDFDDMVCKCRELFLSHPEILDVYRTKYRYILIDEFQDINPLQYEIIRMLAAPTDNLFIVGDDDQSIYAFRGAAPELMLRFPTDYPLAKRVLLDVNYRSTASIVDTSLRYVSKNSRRYSKKLKAAAKGGNDVSLLSCKTREEETETVCRLIRAAARHMPYKEIAVLFRTNASASRYSYALASAGIPFFVKEKTGSIFDTAIGKDILAILSFAHGEKTRTNFLRFMNKPLRYIPRNIVPEKNIDISSLAGKSGLSKSTSTALCRLAEDMRILKSMHPYAAINYIRKGMDYELHIIREAREKGRDSSETLETLNELSAFAKEVDTYEEWLESIENYKHRLSSENAPENAVQLMTMHGSKGLEYRTVIIPDLNEGILPPKNATEPAQLEEERRILYVAMTRAKEKLILLYLEKNAEHKTMPSRFVKELNIK